MNMRVWVGVICSALMLAVGPAQATLLSVVAFGDSLIDTGGGPMPVRPPQPPDPYAGGRYTNGPTTTEVLAARLGATLTSYAIGGGQSGVGNVDVPDTADPAHYTGVHSQIAQYLTDVGGIADADALFIVQGGSNDFLGWLACQVGCPTFDDVAEQVVLNLAGAVQTLYAAGAKQFVLPLLPDIGSAPAVQSPVVSAAMLGVNAALVQTYQGLYAALGDPSVKFTLFDTFAVQNQLTSQFDNASDACLDEAQGTLCGSPDTFFFWDALHPSAAASELLGDQLADLVVPEPAGMVVPALLALALLRRRARRQPQALVA